MGGIYTGYAATLAYSQVYLLYEYKTSQVLSLLALLGLGGIYKGYAATLASFGPFSGTRFTCFTGTTVLALLVQRYGNAGVVRALLRYSVVYLLYYYEGTKTDAAAARSALCPLALLVQSTKTDLIYRYKSSKTDAAAACSALLPLLRALKVASTKVQTLSQQRELLRSSLQRWTFPSTTALDSVYFLS